MAALDSIRGDQETWPLDTSAERSAFLLIGKNGGHIRVSPSARQLLLMAGAGLSFEAMAERLARQTGRTFSPSEIEAAYRQVVSRIEEIDSKASREALPAGFWLKRTMLPSELVRALAQKLAIAFHPAAAVVFGAGICAAIAFQLGGVADPAFTERSHWPSYGLFLISLLFHELGHASACARYGAQPSDIGFAIYLIYPALYSDVTPAWKLKRWQRVVVDLGGNYFQCIAGVVYVGAYLLSGAEIFRVASLMILYAAAFSLNPFFKFDGYWILADAMGVTELGRQPALLGKYALSRFRRQTGASLPWPRPIILMLAIYTLLSFAFWAFFLWKLLPSIWQATWQFPGRIAEVLGSIVQRGSVAWPLLGETAWSAFVLVIAYLMLARLSQPLVARLQRAHRHSAVWDQA